MCINQGLKYKTKQNETKRNEMKRNETNTLTADQKESAKRYIIKIAHRMIELTTNGPGNIGACIIVPIIIFFLTKLRRIRLQKIQTKTRTKHVYQSVYSVR
jgi:hypothetical protein